MLRNTRWALLIVGLNLAGCGSGDPKVERQGDPVPDPMADGGSPGANVGDGGSASGDPIPFCDALRVLRAKCQRCHQDPPSNGAPVPFLTYEDTQAPYGASGFKYSDAMISAVENGQMPFVAANNPPINIMPPVEPLTAEEKDTLLTWLKQGAKPVGGTDCP